MLYIEYIEYGDVELLADIASVKELYARLGLIHRLHAGDIESPNSIIIHEEDGERLRELMKLESNRRRKTEWARTNRNLPDGYLFWEWITYGPKNGCSKKGVLEIHSKKQGVSKLDIIP